VHFEIDVPDPNQAIPVNTTAEIGIHVGQPSPALMIPLSAAAVRGEKVSVFVVDGDVARARVLHLKGERAGELFLEPSLPAGARIVTEGRALLSDGDRVSASIDDALATSEAANAADVKL
jgi:multidrug efflux pump subunit AcrA (membrane-fusion protein)